MDEEAILDLKKRDFVKPPEIISNMSLARGQLVSIEISIAKSVVPGQIISKLSPKLAEFFNYKYREFCNNISNVN